MALPEYKPFKVDYNQLFGNDLYGDSQPKTFWDYDRLFAEQNLKELQTKVAEREASKKLDAIERADSFSATIKDKLAQNPNLSLSDLDSEIKNFFLASGDVSGLMKMEEEKNQRAREQQVRQRDDLKFQMEMDKFNNPPMEYRSVDGRGLVAVNPRTGQTQIVMSEAEKPAKDKKIEYKELINPSTGELIPVVAGSPDEALARANGFLENTQSNQGYEWMMTRDNFLKKQRGQQAPGDNQGALSPDQKSTFRTLLEGLMPQGPGATAANAVQQPIQDKVIAVRRKDR